jgi:hypothetical protein
MSSESDIMRRARLALTAMQDEPGSASSDVEPVKEKRNLKE